MSRGQVPPLSHPPLNAALMLLINYFILKYVNTEIQTNTNIHKTQSSHSLHITYDVTICTYKYFMLPKMVRDDYQKCEGSHKPLIQSG